ncbi:MAG: hypothetical protein IMF10_01455 [Proteobacteria bacterium]|nr:hypothetical protein [Pseudomonadota bacterium]
MIVITCLVNRTYHVCPGDEFNLTVRDNYTKPGANISEVIIREVITVTKIINFIASFRFCLEDGTCSGFHLAGIFANKDELPREIREAKKLTDLTDEQYKNFTKSLGVDIARR